MKNNRFGDIMKNSKIIVLTTIVIAMALGGVLGASKFFENFWQRGDEVENTLNAEIVDEVENIFNYPYTIDDGQTIEWDSEYISTPPQEAISFQEAANIAGETLKYMYGFTAHQTVPAKICYHNRPDTAYNFAGVKSYYYDFRHDDTEAFVFVDAFTGEPILFQLMSDENNDDVPWPEMSMQDKEKLMSDVSPILQYLDKPPIVKTGITNIYLSDFCDKNTVKARQVNIILKDETQVQLWFIIDGENEYRFVAYKNLTMLNSENLYFDDIEFTAEQVRQ